jgi:hypothetical protein
MWQLFTAAVAAALAAAPAAAITAALASALAAALASALAADLAAVFVSPAADLATAAIYRRAGWHGLLTNRHDEKLSNAGNTTVGGLAHVVTSGHVVNTK